LEIVELDDLTVKFQEFDGVLVINASPKDEPLLPFIDSNVIHALMFTSMSNARPVYVLESRPDRETLSLFSPERNSWRSRFNPPVQPSDESASAYWQLFRCFLSFLRQRNSPEWHPFVVESSKIVTASLVGLEAFVPTLSIGVEAVIKESAFRDHSAGVIDKETVQRLQSHVREWVGDESVIDRACNLLNMMRQPRAKDVLFQLESAGLIEKRHINAWSKLRNPSAHGESSYDDHDDGSLHEDIALATTLFHRIILDQIGYDGEFRDYSDPSMPLVTLRRKRGD
ncbi:MAG: hypothetical protein ACREA0_22480, partial [bacterium]